MSDSTTTPVTQQTHTNATAAPITGAVAVLGLAFALSQMTAPHIYAGGPIRIQTQTVRTDGTMAVIPNYIAAADYELLTALLTVQETLVSESVELPADAKVVLYANLWNLYD